MVVSWTVLLAVFLFIPPLLLLLHLSLFSKGVGCCCSVPLACPNPNPLPDPGVWHWVTGSLNDLQVTARRGPDWGWCIESRWVLAFGMSSLEGCWPLRLPFPPEGKSQIQNHPMSHGKPNFEWLSSVCCCLTCPGVMSVGSGPWWNSRWSFPEWRSNTNCFNLPGILQRTHKCTNWKSCKTFFYISLTIEQTSWIHQTVFTFVIRSFQPPFHLCANLWDLILKSRNCLIQYYDNWASCADAGNQQMKEKEKRASGLTPLHLVF